MPTVTAIPNEPKDFVANLIQKSRALELLREGKMRQSGKAILVDEVRKAWNDTQGAR
jgi:hypothetical protein